MVNKVFGELTFNVGWKSSSTIVFCGEECEIILKVKAYFEKDGITNEQEQAYKDYLSNKEEKFAKIKQLLDEYSENAANQFVPTTLLFERDGAYALLCDDKENPDEGIAVCLSPIEQIMSQDDYL